LRQPGTDALAASSPLPGAAVRCAPTDVRRHFAAVSIDDAQYPVVAGFAGRLAQDHAEQEFTDGLRELLDRLAAHPGASVQVGLATAGLVAGPVGPPDAAHPRLPWA